MLSSQISKVPHPICLGCIVGDANVGVAIRRHSESTRRRRPLLRYRASNTGTGCFHPFGCALELTVTSVSTSLPRKTGCNELSGTGPVVAECVRDRAYLWGGAGAAEVGVASASGDVKLVVVCGTDDNVGITQHLSRTKALPGRCRFRRYPERSFRFLKIYEADNVGKYGNHCYKGKARSCESSLVLSGGRWGHRLTASTCGDDN